MMTIADQQRYETHRSNRLAGNWGSSLVYELWLPMLLFASAGAITWAIRGTTGWGGIDGTIVPGLTWGVLWYYLCYRKGIDARGAVFWLGMGLALGGELGYGQYVGWTLGRFNVGDEILPIAPGFGYLWFAVCGIGWAAPGGILLGWALSDNASRSHWALRSGLFLVLLVFILNLGAPLLGTGAVEWLGTQLAQYCPGLLFPKAHLGIYDGELDRHLARTVYTNTQNFAIVVWWVAAMAVAFQRRDRVTLVSGAVIGGGFGIGFPLSAVWCLGYNYAPQAVDWWKMWELHSGVNLGILYAIFWYWGIRDFEHRPATPDSPPATAGTGHRDPSRTGVFMALVGFVLIFVAGHEYFFWTGLAVSIAFAAVMLYATFLAGGGDAAATVERQKSALFIFSVFFLVFMLFHGMSITAGVLLELYTEEAVEQYDWPPARIAIFAPVALLLSAAALVQLAKAFRGARDKPSCPAVHLRMFDLLTLIGFVGAASIWPAKIGVLYALFLAFAIFALARLNDHFDRVDRAA